GTSVGTTWRAYLPCAAAPLARTRPSELTRALSRFIAAMMRTSENVKARQVSAVIWNMANSSDLRCLDRSALDAVRDSTVPGRDSLGRSPAGVLWSPPDAYTRS